ncbi:hypothetical protein [Paenibacillus segetis]|uniref:Phage transcriptional regulator, ArpU family n=1 Tax=Paenibacillus segetis TaxID=1325360 RepID=A0ABQ1YKL2_9BACL|nr:hypothetical protein [Paenibacillus segetis]GGH27616.1 hypothetical protein GCM10008013_29190 [Paenibacillus segetis]
MSNQEVKNTVVTVEEMTMIRDYILLPHLEKMVQKSLADIEYSNNVLKRLYLMAGHTIIEMISSDLRRLRRELKQSNIKILDAEQSDYVVFHYYYCRGYKEQFGMSREAMRTELSWKLSKYISDLTTFLKTEQNK